MNKITRKDKIRKKIRKFRIRKKIIGTKEQPRLVLHCSNRYLYAQIIDDINQVTLLNYSTLSQEIRDTVKSKKNKDASAVLGSFIGTKAVEKGIKQVKFDRNGRLFHGRVKAFADSVREKGIQF